MRWKGIYLNICGFGTVPRQNTKVERDIRIPLPVLAALLQAFNIAGLRNEWKQDLGL